MGKNKMLPFGIFIWGIFLIFGLTRPIVAQNSAAIAQDSAVAQDSDPVHALRGHRVFEPLPAGAVKPSGWLRDWALAAKNGYTAVMDDVDPEFTRAWTADFSPTCPVGDWGHGSWSYEGGGYWFDGLVRLAYQLEDKELLAMVSRRLAPVLEHATPEGIGHFYWLNRKNESDLSSVRPDYGWGLWASGLYGRAMITYYGASGDERALRAMQCADDSSDIGCITIAGLGSPPNNAINACEDYARSGDTGVAETLTRFFEHRDVEWQSLWEPYRTPPVDALWCGEKHYPEDWVMRFHGVFLNETLAGWAAGTLWTGRPEFLETAVAWQKLMDEKCLQPYGALVEDELYGPTGAYRCTETCTLAAELWRRIQMFTMTGVGEDADRVERLFFNAGAGTTTRDFTQHVYFQQPNRISPNSFIYSWGNKTNCTFRRKHYPLCCTAGVNRILPTYIQYQWMKTSDQGLAAILYAPNRLDTTVRGTRVSIDSTTDYPFQETVTMSLTLDQSTAFPILLRIPQWCKNPTVTLNHEKINLTTEERPFLRIERTWNTGDTIVLNFPMEPRLEQGIDRNAKSVTMPTGGAWGKGSVLGQFANTELSGVPCASISLGPLLFALPIPEENGDENKPVHDAAWQYALDPNHALDAVTVERSDVPHPWAWPREAPIQLRVQACSAQWTHDTEFPRLPKADEMEIGASRTISLIPYGCAKLRVSMFPVAEQPSPSTITENEPAPAADAAHPESDVASPDRDTGK
ncbi:MAG: glycoside hydrolase family 127 protein [Thermoguttaceae bacterium]|nr:glycoside hydrolase family 127 protein [Thermoguttaceae bacterium]